MPLIKMSSTTLSLQPTARSKSVNLFSTWRTTHKTNFYSDNINNGSSNQFKNSKVSSIINNPQL